MVNRLSRYALLLALSMMLWAPTARAQQPERVALHPCVITGEKGAAPVKKSRGKKAAAAAVDIAELEAICATSALRDTMSFVPSDKVRDFLDKEAHGSCAKAKNRNMCLGRLAASTQATRALYITLDPFNPKVTHVTGLVVDENGNEVEQRPLDLPRLPNQPPRDVVRFAVSQVLDQLQIAKPAPVELLPVPGVQPEPPPIVAQPTPPPAQQPAAPIAATQQEAPRGRTWKTPAGITGMVLGGVGLIASGVFVASGNSKAKTFTDAYAGGALPQQSELVGLDQDRKDADSMHSLAAISASAGAVLAAGGLVLWLVDRPSSSGEAPPPPKAGTARLIAGPNQVGLLVLLP